MGPIIPRDHVASYGSLSLLFLQLRSGRGNSSVYYVTVVVVGQQVLRGGSWGQVTGCRERVRKDVDGV